MVYSDSPPILEETYNTIKIKIKDGTYIESNARLIGFFGHVELISPKNYDINDFSYCTPAEVLIRMHKDVVSTVTRNEVHYFHLKNEVMADHFNNYINLAYLNSKGVKVKGESSDFFDFSLPIQPEQIAVYYVNEKQEFIKVDPGEYGVYFEYLKDVSLRVRHIDSKLIKAIDSVEIAPEPIL